MEMVADAQGLRLHVATADLAQRLVFSVAADGSLTAGQDAALPTGGIPVQTLAAIEVGGTPLLVALVPLSASAGEIVAIDPATGQSFAFLDATGRAAAVAVVDAGASEVVYVAHADSAALDCFLRDASGNFVRITTIPTGGEGGIAALHVVGTDGQALLIAADTAGNLHSFAVAPGGGLVPAGEAGVASGLGINGPSEGEIVFLDGQAYLIQTGTGSSSLSVLRIGADGSLTPTDHVIDSLATRFQSLTALDAVTLDGRVHVVAGGADGGVSLFSLLPDGTLYHHGAAFNGPAAALTSVNAIEAVAAGGVIHVYASSEDAPGLIRLTLTPGPAGLTLSGGAGGETLHGGAGDDVLFGGAGDDLILGGAGDDILIDGAGSDTLRGGAGADIFVLVADGEADVIADFDRSRDRIDLSRWPLLRNPGQIEVTPTGWGARVVYGNEVLEVHTLDGMPLSAAEIAALGVLNLDHSLTPEMPRGVTLDGTGGDDTLAGTVLADILRGFGGNDVLRGLGGGDLLDGGPGFDYVDYSGSPVAVIVDLAAPEANSGGALDDTLIGIEGVIGSAVGDRISGDGAANTLIGGPGNDTLVGRDGNDRLEGGEGDDVLDGGPGHDELLGGAGNDTILGGPGNDHIAAGEGGDHVDGGPGNDRIGGGPGNDTLDGGDGDDFLGGGEGDDVVRGGPGNDVVNGGAGRDWLEGGDGNDTMGGSYHDDTIFGGAGHDSIGGGPGADLIFGGAGSDTIGGGPGRDTIHGGPGNDFLAGGEGADWIDGGEGNDRLNGGPGNDTLIGGPGADTFVFAAFTPGERDRILDFEDGTDHIVVTGIPGASLRARLDALAITDTATGVTMGWNGHVIEIDGISAPALTLEDFTFL